MSSRKKLFDSFLSAGFADINQHDPQYEHHAEMFAQNYIHHLPERKDARILEIGFGMGQFLRFLKEQGYTNYEGIEVSQEMFDFVAQHESGAVTLVNDIATFLQERRDTYDVIVFNDVIEHMEKAQIIPNLEVIRQSLTDEGYVLIKTNNVAAVTGARMRFEDFTHEWSFTPYSLRQALRVAGYVRVSIMPFAFPVNSPKRVLRKVLQMMQHGLWKFVYFVEFTTIPPIVHEFMFAKAYKQ